MKDLVYVGGSKGGTGKSLTCMALVDYFRKNFPQDEILLIETDSSNPDVGRLYNGSSPMKKR
jgi:MinD superfamily P-loop ATPase